MVHIVAPVAQPTYHSCIIHIVAPVAHKKSMLRQRILGDGRGVEDRFWKYRRSNRPDSQMRVLLVACRELALDYDTFPTICFWT